MVDSSLRIDPPLPCASLGGDRLCRKPATIALISSVGEGRYLMQPICRDCVAALANIYLPKDQTNGATAES